MRSANTRTWCSGTSAIWGFGAFGICSRDNADRIDAYELSPKIGMAPWPSHQSVTELSTLGQILSFYRPLEHLSRHVVVPTDASTMGWGAVCNGQAALGSWKRTLPCAGCGRCFRASMCLSTWTTQRWLRTSTAKAVYAHFACHNSSSGVSSDSGDSGRSTPFKFTVS